MSILIDTDVLIWHLRGFAQAAETLDRYPKFLLSAMSHLELLQGMRNKEEIGALRGMLSLRGVAVLPLTAAVSARATELMIAQTLSHGLQAADALIAATALEHGLKVLTGNVKHFAPIPGLEVEKFALSPP
jgi:hypothetical protein